MASHVSIRRSIAVLAVGLALCLARPLHGETPTRTAWEYKVVRTDSYPEEALLAKLLNSLGAEGWELVGASNGHNGSAAFTVTYLFFKRPK